MSVTDGWVAPGFEAVADAFLLNFSERAEVGAALCVHHRGEVVVDLWGGVADPVTGRPWEPDTLCLVFSCTKGITATCVHLLIERGMLDPDAPVASYWPEFAANGKGDIPVRWLLGHRAGLAVIDADLTFDESLSWFPVVEALAAQAPNWEPGTDHGYHLRSYGWLVGELVRRVDGRTVGRFVADELAGPLGLDVYVGLPADLEPRVATLVPPPPAFAELIESLPDELLLGRATTGPSGHFSYTDMWNTRRLHEVELPSSNGIVSARSLSRLYAALVGTVPGEDGAPCGPVLHPTVMAAATEVQSSGTDRVIMVDTTFGLGYMLGPSMSPACPSAAFGHPGAGGSLAFADPVAEVGFAYVPNDLRFDPAETVRSSSLVDATYRAIERSGR